MSERGAGKAPPGRGSVFASVFTMHVKLTFVFAGEEMSCLLKSSCRYVYVHLDYIYLYDKATAGGSL